MMALLFYLNKYKDDPNKYKDDNVQWFCYYMGFCYYMDLPLYHSRTA